MRNFVFFLLETMLSGSLLMNSLQAVDYFLDAENGNDGSSGHSSALAWRSLERLASLDLRPGDAIRLRGGQIFPGSILISEDGSGIAGKPVLISSYGDGIATIDAGAGIGISIDSARHIIVENLKITGCGRNNGNNGHGIKLRNSQNVEIRDTEISGFRLAGFHSSGDSDTRIIRVHAHDNGAAGIEVCGWGENLSSNIYIAHCIAENNPGDPENKDNHSGNGIVVGGLENAVIEYCVASNNGWDMPRKGNGPVGIWGWNCKNLTIQHCIAYKNKSPGEDGGGFDLDGGCTDSVMQYNLSYGNAGAGYLLCQYPGAPEWKNNIVRYNISYHDGIKNTGAGIAFWAGDKGISHALVHDNIVVNPRHGMVFVASSHSISDVIIRNNIFITGGKSLWGEIGEFNFADNLFWPGAGKGEIGLEPGVAGAVSDPGLNLPESVEDLPTDPAKLAEMKFFRFGKEKNQYLTSQLAFNEKKQGGALMKAQKKKEISHRPLNVVLICADQWRGDCLSIAGHPVVHTPYLDDLCLNGCRFDAAYTATPSCIPARAALFTGKKQSTHGRVGYRDGVPWNYDNYLAGEFTRHGYQTQAIGKMHVYPERSQCGFQNVILHDGFLHFARREQRENLDMIDDYIPWLREKTGNPSSDYFDHGLNCNSFVARPWDKPEELHPTNFIVTQGIDFLRRRDPRKPFFLYLSFHRPHPPLDPPAWAYEQYLDSDMPEPPVGDWESVFDSSRQPNRSDLSVGELRPDVLRRARAGYYGSITHIDHQINRFLEFLVDYGFGDNTLICFTSDHGEMLGDHHLFRKSMPYEGSAKIPLVFKGPGVPSGAVSSVPAELRDVMPTLMNLAGLPVPDSVEGENLCPAMDGRTEGFKDYIHGEHTTLGQSIQWLTDGRKKYVWMSASGTEQLFDLKKDPGELHDLAGEDHAELKKWRQRLINELNGREEGFSDGTKLVPGRPVNPVLEHIRSSE